MLVLLAPGSLHVFFPLPSTHYLWGPRVATGSLGWLIVCDNLTGLSDIQIAGKISLGASVGISEEISIRISRPSQGKTPSPMRVGIIQLVKGLNRTRRLRKGEFALCWHILPLLPLDIGTPRFRVFLFGLGLTLLADFQAGTALYSWLSWFSSLHMAGHGTSQLL